MKPLIFTKTLSVHIALILILLTTSTSAHPLHTHHHFAPRERVPFWNDPGWGNKAPETPQPMATVMTTKLIPTPFADPVTEGFVPAKQTTTPGIASPAPTPAPAPTTTPVIAPPRSASSIPAKKEKSCLDLSLWATAMGRSPMMSVAGSLSKNKEPICSIWALVDQASPKPVELSCMKGHEASFRFDNGGGRYEGDGQPVNFNVIRSEEAKVDGKEAWSWKVIGCWDE